MATKTKKETKAFSKEELIAAAEELESVMELDTPVDPEADEEAIRTYIIDAGGEVLKGDKFSEETDAILEHYAKDIKATKKEKTQEGPAPTKTSEKKTEPKAKAEKSAPTDGAIAAFNAATKLADLKDVAQDYDEFKSLRKKLDDYKGLPGLKELRGKMEKMLNKKGAPAVTKAEKTAGKSNDGGRTTKEDQFIAELEKGPKTMSQIKAAKWNTNDGTFYNLFNQLVKDGKAKKDGKNMVLL